MDSPVEVVFGLLALALILCVVGTDLAKRR